MQNRRMGQLLLQGQSLTGTGPAITISGWVEVPLDLTVVVTAGVLGVGLVTVTANGQTLLSGVLSAASMLLTGLLSGVTLNLSAGLYLGNTYTLTLP